MNVARELVKISKLLTGEVDFKGRQKAWKSFSGGAQELYGHDALTKSEYVAINKIAKTAWDRIKNNQEV